MTKCVRCKNIQVSQHHKILRGVGILQVIFKKGVMGAGKGGWDVCFAGRPNCLIEVGEVGGGVVVGYC